MQHAPRSDPIRVTLRRAILGAIAFAILAGIVPAGIALDARLAAALEDRARSALLLAPRILADRNAVIADGLMMHAKELAHEPELIRAMLTGDRAAVDHVVSAQSGAVPSGIPVIVGANGESLAGPIPDSSIVMATRAGKMPVEMQADSGRVHTFALAPITADGEGRWLGAAGFAVAFTEDVARSLESLTGSEVIIISARSGEAVASTLDSSLTRSLVRTLAAHARADSAPVVARADGDRILAITTRLNDAGYAAFARLMRQELAILPALRRVALFSGAGALAVALLLGLLLATAVTHPVRELAHTARSLGEGNFAAPLPRTRFEEVRTVATTFATMRDALAARLAELRGANRELEDRAQRLAALQTDLVQRERLAASARLVTHLAHEVRNPVATLRNLLEVIQRRSEDVAVREYAELAIDELLRMHELAERMFDLNRPQDPALQVADAAQVARDIARLMSVASDGGDGPDIEIAGVDETATARISPDALKQVLINVIQNANEAVRLRDRSSRANVQIVVRRDTGTVTLSVSDNGPGIARDVLPRVFDPFFTTKESVHGVGLGLFVAEGIVRAAGGRLTARNRPSGGAEFVIELPVAEDVLASASHISPKSAV